MWYTINISGAKLCQLDLVEDRNMKILTCAPNSFLTAAPPPRRLHAPHPCAQPSDAAAPEIEITPPYTDVNYYIQFSARADKPNTLLDTAPAKEPPRGYSRCTKMTMSSGRRALPVSMQYRIGTRMSLLPRRVGETARSRKTVKRRNVS